MPNRQDTDVAIDDFGTGYSSLSHLHRFPIDSIKIDRSFIARLRGGGEESALVRSIIELGNTLHLQTVAEGIEHLEELTLLRHLGALVGQGYFFAKPLTASDAGALLERTGERPMIAALGRPARVAASAQRARLPRVALATTPGERLSVH